ncbi:cytoplasmic tRNA 2-thiolation protein 2 [Lepeophtheirus salmonis]|uniref:cytoplasmic tRNA 2-thiolation protein 2 n=1 Tax=Lepeophtheirus salmonis TaxID=72036 RepID=UPI001AE2DF82|nr:cytoplasmic tRNA 2-thiolation protein 2-A-like [Lepeophtheirus salmonis]
MLELNTFSIAVIMCSIIENGLVKNEEEEDDQTSVLSNLCKKCKNVEHVVTLRKKDSYCEACFISNCLHKFRSTLGKNKAISRNDRVLVVFDGGSSATALLHLLNSGFDDPSSKKVVYTPIFLILKRSLDLNESLDEVITHATRYSFETKIVNFEVSSMDYETLKFDSKPRDIENCLFDGAKDAGSKLYLFRQYWNKIIIAAALKLECTKIMTGDSATDCAVSLLSGIAQGRGVNVAQDVAFSETVNDKLNIIRPMREFSRQEIEFYNCFNRLIPPFPEHSRFEGVRGETIQKLSEKFVVGLQEDYPATIPTIFRTGDKLSANKYVEETKKCLLCSGILDTNLDKPCSLQATRFSELLSQKGAKQANVDEFLDSFTNLSNCSSEQSECCGKGDGECQSSTLNREDIEKELCYSCRINFSESYPDYLVFQVRKNKSLDKMRDDIKDFLL